ncbi:MAG: hypothetical protein ACKPCM_00120 [Pseudanabaena sp.]
MGRCGAGEPRTTSTSSPINSFDLRKSYVYRDRRHEYNFWEDLLARASRYKKLCRQINLCYSGGILTENLDVIIITSNLR